MLLVVICVLLGSLLLRTEIEILYELAMLGNMKKIRQRAQYLKSLDAKYTLLADKLDELAQGFQEKAILELIEQYLWS